MAGLEIRMEYSGGRTGMIRALAAEQVLAWLITAALLLAIDVYKRQAQVRGTGEVRELSVADKH